jgi:hypothetical protein
MICFFTPFIKLRKLHLPLGSCGFKVHVPSLDGLVSLEF